MAKNIPAKEFKAAVKALNVILKEAEEAPIKIVGVKKEQVTEDFTNIVLNFIEEERSEELPDEVIEIYNTYIATEDTDDEEEEKPKSKTKGKAGAKKGKAGAKKEKKEKKPAGPKVGYEIIRAIVENDNCLDRKKVLDEVAKVFPDRNKDGMRTTVNHVVGVMTNYFGYVNTKK